MNWSHIDSWLSTLYKEEEIPYFERTNKNYEILNNLKKLNFNSTKLVENYIINTDNVDHNNNNNALESLGSMGQLLGISQTELSNYYTAISKVSMKKMEDEKLNEIETTLNGWEKEMSQELTNLKAVLSKLHQQKSCRDDNKYDLNKSEYLILKKKYNDLNISTRLNYLYNLDLNSNQIENDIEFKSSLLDSVLHLPPDIELASIKIQETEDELHELETKREYLLSDLLN